MPSPQAALWERRKKNAAEDMKRNVEATNRRSKFNEEEGVALADEVEREALGTADELEAEAYKAPSEGEE